MSKNESPALKGERDPKLTRPVWYLEGPFYQYNEDVKALATRAGLRIIDSTQTDDRTYAADEDRLPSVTKKSKKAMPSMENAQSMPSNPAEFTDSSSDAVPPKVEEGRGRAAVVDEGPKGDPQTVTSKAKAK